MNRVALVLLSIALLWGGQAFCQGFDYCADVNEDGQTNVGDLATMLDSHMGGPALPSGRGDIDFREGINLGDIRYFSGWLFLGWSEGGCPPFDPYPLETTDDSLFLPARQIDPGAGDFSLQVVLINHEPVTDLLIPFEITGVTGDYTVTGIDLGSSVPDAISVTSMLGAAGTILFSTVSEAMGTGTNLIATVHVHYENSTGGTIWLASTTPDPTTFVHYMYGPFGFGIPYDSLTIAKPHELTVFEPGFPSMELTPDSLYFETLVGYPDPDPQQFSVLSSGAPFNWYATSSQTWAEADPTLGASGDIVTVTPHISGLGVGVHTADIVVYSTEALNSPQTVKVVVYLKPQYPSLDANCDGIFNITDIVTELNYIFGGGVIPCDPCTGEPTMRK